MTALSRKSGIPLPLVKFLKDICQRIESTKTLILKKAQESLEQAEAKIRDHKDMVQEI